MFALITQPSGRLFRPEVQVSGAFQSRPDPNRTEPTRKVQNRPEQNRQEQNRTEPTRKEKNKPKQIPDHTWHLFRQKQIPAISDTVQTKTDPATSDTVQTKTDPNL